MAYENLDYMYEKCSLAVYTLATGDWPLKERVWDAYCSSLHVLAANEDELPDESRPIFKAIESALSTVDGNDEVGGVRASLDAMDDEQVKHVAKRIVELFCVIARHEAKREGGPYVGT